MRQFDNLKMLSYLLITTMLFLSCRKDETYATPKATDAVVSNKYDRTEDESCGTNFDVFFEKFSKDSVFQKLHVKFPLKNSHLDDEYHDMVREDIPLSKYIFIDFSKHKDAMKNEYDKFSVEIKKQKDSVFYFMRGYDNGIMTKIKFSYNGNCWDMVEIVDEST